MTQKSFTDIPGDTSGNGLADLINQWRAAVETNHSGAARPAYAQGGMLWVEEVSSALWTLNLFDGDSDIALEQINPTTNAIIPRSIEAGGTGASSAEGARIALGLTDLMTGDAANAVSVNQAWEAQIKVTYAANHALWGLSTDGNGVRGESTNSFGGYFASTTSDGVVGKTSTSTKSGVEGVNHDGTITARLGFGGYGIWTNGAAHVAGALTVIGDISANNLGTAAAKNVGTGTDDLWTGATIQAAMPSGGTAIGSGSIAEVHLASGAVSQSKLKTTLGSGFVAADQSAALPGGAYGFMPTASGDGLLLRPGSILNSGGGSAGWQQRYMNASPPYDLGDGMVHGFIFVALDAAGDVQATYISEVPPWVYNGPTDVRPSFYDEDDRPMRYRRKAGHTIKDVVAGKLTMAEYMEQGNALETAADIYEAVPCADLYHADMAVIPHPFAGPGIAEVVLLDPMAEQTGRLLFDMLMAAETGDGDPVSDALVRGVLRFDNQALSRHGPPGVKQVSYR